MSRIFWSVSLLLLSACGPVPEEGEKLPPAQTIQVGEFLYDLEEPTAAPELTQHALRDREHALRFKEQAKKDYARLRAMSDEQYAEEYRAFYQSPEGHTYRSRPRLAAAAKHRAALLASYSEKDLPDAIDFLEAEEDLEALDFSRQPTDGIWGADDRRVPPESALVDPATGFKSTAFFLGRNSAGKIAACSGAVVHPKVILTAAHCLDRFRSGALNTIEYVQTRVISRYEFHWVWRAVNDPTCTPAIHIMPGYRGPSTKTFALKSDLGMIDFSHCPNVDFPHSASFNRTSVPAGTRAHNFVSAGYPATLCPGANGGPTLCASTGGWEKGGIFAWGGSTTDHTMYWKTRSVDLTSGNSGGPMMKYAAHYRTCPFGWQDYVIGDGRAHVCKIVPGGPQYCPTGYGITQTSDGMSICVPLVPDTPKVFGVVSHIAYDVQVFWPPMTVPVNVRAVDTAYWASEIISRVPVLR